LLVLPHKIVPPPTDLRLLPRPIYQRSFAPDVATLVVPDKPTASELQAALSVAAGFGKMTDNQLSLTMTRVSELSKEARDNNHLIFVGRAAGLPALREAAVPVALKDRGVEAQADDGIVQMVVSPWNPAKVVLAVTGQSDAAVVKAGQAVGTGNIVPTGEPDLAVVAEVRQQASDAIGPVAVRRSLTDLGYLAQTMRSQGTNRVEYRFEVPAGLVADAESYVELLFNHSALLDYTRSEMLVSLNNEPIGSARFSDETAQQGKLRLHLPSSAVRPGENRLTVQALLAPNGVCADPRQTNLWLTMRPESVIHLPMSPAEGVQPGGNLDLSRYSNLDVFGLKLDQLAFVLPNADPTAWAVASRVAFDLGDRAEGNPAGIVAHFADAVPDEVRQGRDLLVVGRASTLPIMSELGEALPAPFAAQSDVADERTLRVTYRMPKGAPVGYLELLSAPWNQERKVLAVLGSTPQGLEWAGSALVTPALRGKLAGNFALVNGEQIVVGDTRLGPNTLNLASNTATGGTGETAPASPATAAAADWRWWIPPAMIASLVLMALIGGFVFSSWLRSRRPAIQ
jgi:hypothetical protein